MVPCHRRCDSGRRDTDLRRCATSGDVSGHSQGHGSYSQKKSVEVELGVFAHASLTGLVGKTPTARAKFYTSKTKEMANKKEEEMKSAKAKIKSAYLKALDAKIDAKDKKAKKDKKDKQHKKDKKSKKSKGAAHDSSTESEPGDTKLKKHKK